MTGRTSTLLVATLTVLIAGCSVRPALSSPPAVPTPTVPASTVPSLPIASSTPAPDPTPPAGSGMTVSLDCEEPAVCRISLLDGAANVLPGWPVAVDGGCLGAATEPSGRVYVVCYGENDPVVHAFDEAGAAVAGWPVSLPAPPATVSFNDFTSICGRHLSPLAVAADGGVYVSTFDEHTRLLHSFDREGRERDGWPQPMPGDSIFGCGGFALLSGRHRDDQHRADPGRPADGREGAAPPAEGGQAQEGPGAGGGRRRGRVQAAQRRASRCTRAPPPPASTWPSCASCTCSPPSRSCTSSTSTRPSSATRRSSTSCAPWSPPPRRSSWTRRSSPS